MGGHTGSCVRVERVKCLGLQKRLCQALQLVAVLAEQTCDRLMGCIDQLSGLFIHEPLSGLRGLACPG